MSRPSEYPDRIRRIELAIVLILQESATDAHPRGKPVVTHSEIARAAQLDSHAGTQPSGSYWRTLKERYPGDPPMIAKNRLVEAARDKVFPRKIRPRIF